MEKVNRDCSSVQGFSWDKYNSYKNVFMGPTEYWKLPLTHRNHYEIATDNLRTANPRILDIGANRRQFQEELKRHEVRCTYKSLDTDKALPHDYQDITEIRDTFDLVSMFAVIEHIHVDDFIKTYLPALARIVRPGGRIVIAMPNVFFNTGIRCDVTHRSPYSPRDLNALLMTAGFEPVSCYRITTITGLWLPFYSFIAKVLRPFALDFAPEVCLVSQKQE